MQFALVSHADDLTCIRCQGDVTQHDLIPGKDPIEELLGPVMVNARHLGVLRPITHLSAELGRRCLSHIKALAELDIAERRRPQDGRWIHTRPSGDTLDLRVSVLPTLYGEDVTLRLLDRTTRLLNLEQLGLHRR